MGAEAHDEGLPIARRKRMGPSEQTTIRLPKELSQRARRIARRHNISLGMVVTAILDKHIAEFDVPAPPKQAS